MNHGHLRIHTSDREYLFPVSDKDRPRNEHDNIRAELKVINPSFWIRLALMSDLGFAEASPIVCFDITHPPSTIIYTSVTIILLGFYVWRRRM